MRNEPPPLRGVSSHLSLYIFKSTMRLETETVSDIKILAPLPGKEPKEFGVFWGVSLFQDVGPKAPIIEHFFYKGDTIFLTAQTGVGKSVFALQMICSLTSGQPFLGSFKVNRPNNVLYLQTEGDRAETLERLVIMAKALPFYEEGLVHVNLDGICLNTAEGFKRFVDLIGEPNIMYDVVIIDPLYTTVKGSLSDDNVATDWVRYMRSLRNMYNCSFVVLHHDTIKENWQDGVRIEKGSKDIMGSTFWGAFMSYNYKLSVKNEVYKLNSGKQRNKLVIDSLELKMIEPDPLMFVIADDMYNLSEAQIQILLKNSDAPLSIREIMTTTKLSRATVYRAFGNLSENKKVRKFGSGSATKYWHNEEIKNV